MIFSNEDLLLCAPSHLRERLQDEEWLKDKLNRAFNFASNRYEHCRKLDDWINIIWKVFTGEPSYDDLLYCYKVFLLNVRLSQASYPAQSDKSFQKYLGAIDLILCPFEAQHAELSNGETDKRIEDLTISK